MNGRLSGIELGAVAAGGFILAVVQVEQVLLAHDGQSSPQTAGPPDGRCAAVVGFSVATESNGRSGGRCCGSTSRSHGRSESTPKRWRRFSYRLRGGRRDHFGSIASWKVQAVLGRIVEAQQLLPAVAAVIGLARRCWRDLRSAASSSCRQSWLSASPVGQLALGDQPPGLLAAGAVARPASAVRMAVTVRSSPFPYHRLCAGDLVVLRSRA